MIMEEISFLLFQVGDIDISFFYWIINFYNKFNKMSEVYLVSFIYFFFSEMQEGIKGLFEKFFK